MCLKTFGVINLLFAQLESHCCIVVYYLILTAFNYICFLKKEKTAEPFLNTSILPLLTTSIALPGFFTRAF
jgi:hypothetical protein